MRTRARLPPARRTRTSCEIHRDFCISAPSDSAATRRHCPKSLSNVVLQPRPISTLDICERILAGNSLLLRGRDPHYSIVDRSLQMPFHSVPLIRVRCTKSFASLVQALLKPSFPEHSYSLQSDYTFFVLLLISSPLIYIALTSRTMPYVHHVPKYDIDYSIIICILLRLYGNNTIKAIITTENASFAKASIKKLCIYFKSMNIGIKKFSIIISLYDSIFRANELNKLFILIDSSILYTSREI
jgi:hypothetical protein